MRNEKIGHHFYSLTTNISWLGGAILVVQALVPHAFADGLSCPRGQSPIWDESRKKQVCTSAKIREAQFGTEVSLVDATVQLQIGIKYQNGPLGSERDVLFPIDLKVGLGLDGQTVLIKSGYVNAAIIRSESSSGTDVTSKDWGGIQLKRDMTVGEEFRGTAYLYGYGVKLIPGGSSSCFPTPDVESVGTCISSWTEGAVTHSPGITQAIYFDFALNILGLTLAKIIHDHDLHWSIALAHLETGFGLEFFRGGKENPTRVRVLGFHAVGDLGYGFGDDVESGEWVGSGRLAFVPIGVEIGGFGVALEIGIRDRIGQNSQEEGFIGLTGAASF